MVRSIATYSDERHGPLQISASMMTAVMTTMMASEVVASMMSAKTSVTPAAAISIVPAPVTVAVWRVEARHINVRSRRVSVIFAAAMTALTSMAMPIATRVGKLDVSRFCGRNMLRWG